MIYISNYAFYRNKTLLISNTNFKMSLKFVKVKNMSNNEIIPQYDIVRQNYSTEEKIILGEIRENLVDLAISSGESFQPDEEKLLNDIIHAVQR